jgi:hypothetical protein
MKRLSLLTATILTIGLFVFSSCTKVEGEGGSSSITGKIVINKKNTAGSIIATYDGQQHDVYIIYGEGGTVHDDKVETSYDGNFEFNFLEKGKYTIYTYEKCTTCPSEEQVILKSVEISKAKEVVNIGTIEVTD